MKYYDAALQTILPEIISIIGFRMEEEVLEDVGFGGWIANVRGVYMAMETNEMCMQHKCVIYKLVTVIWINVI